MPRLEYPLPQANLRPEDPRPKTKADVLPAAAAAPADQTKLHVRARWPWESERNCANASNASNNGSSNPANATWLRLEIIRLFSHNVAEQGRQSNVGIKNIAAAPVLITVVTISITCTGNNQKQAPNQTCTDGAGQEGRSGASECSEVIHSTVQNACLNDKNEGGGEGKEEDRYIILYCIPIAALAACLALSLVALRRRRAGGAGAPGAWKASEFIGDSWRRLLQTGATLEARGLGRLVLKELVTAGSGGSGDLYMGKLGRSQSVMVRQVAQIACDEEEAREQLLSFESELALMLTLQHPRMLNTRGISSFRT